MIIKYRIPNPALAKDYPNDITRKFAENNHINEKAWFYSDYISGFRVYDAVDGNNEIRTMIEVIDSKTSERSVFYIDDIAYVMNDNGKTIETIVSHVKSVETSIKK